MMRVVVEEEQDFGPSIGSSCLPHAYNRTLCTSHFNPCTTL